MNKDRDFNSAATAGTAPGKRVGDSLSVTGLVRVNDSNPNASLPIFRGIMGEDKYLLSSCFNWMVGESVWSQAPNKVLRAPPGPHPSSGPSQTAAASVLSELCSGYCSRLPNCRHSVCYSDSPLLLTTL